MTANFYHLVMPASRPGDRTALIDANDARTTYGELDAMAATFATVLAAAGVRVGDRVAVQTKKSVEALALYLSCLRGGFAYVPINTAFRNAETARVLEHAQPAAFIVAPACLGYADALRETGCVVLTLDQSGGGTLMERAGEVNEIAPVADVPAEALAILLYTSGTTGAPKGAMLSHGATSANAITLTDCWRFTADDVLLHCLPMFHAHGLSVSTHCALLAGATMLWMPRFDAAEVISLLPRVSVFMGVPTLYTRLMASPALTPDACSALRLFCCGSAALTEQSFTQFERASGHRIVERYGMTETGINASNPVDGKRKPGSVGLPLAGTQIRIMRDDDMIAATGQEGEVQVRGPSLASSYWRNPEATAASFSQDGWFSTGDWGRVDDDGYLFLVSRVKDIIITGGYNVYPPEVEAALETLSGVREAAVIGVPHADFGEAVLALVVVEDGFDDGRALMQLKTALANYKVPKKLVVVGELPRNAMGKVLKPDLRMRFCETFVKV